MKKTIGGLVAGVSAIGVAMGMLGSASAAPVWETGRALGRIDNARGLNQAALRAQSETIAQGMVKAGKGELKAFRSDVDALGSTHVRMHQYHQGRRVYGADLVLHVRGNGDAYLLNGRYADANRAPQGAALTAEAALAKAAASLGVGAYTTVGAPELAYVVGDDGETVRLAWRVLIDYRAGDKAERDYLFADATTGDIAAVHPTVKYAKNWRSYDANRAAYTSSTLPGTLVCSNTQFCPLADAQDALRHIGKFLLILGASGFCFGEGDLGFAGHRFQRLRALQGRFALIGGTFKVQRQPLGLLLRGAKLHPRDDACTKREEEEDQMGKVKALPGNGDNRFHSASLA